MEYKLKIFGVPLRISRVPQVWKRCFTAQYYTVQQDFLLPVDTLRRPSTGVSLL